MQAPGMNSLRFHRPAPPTARATAVAALGAVLLTTSPRAVAEDAVSREFSVFCGLSSPGVATDAVAREFSVYVGTAEQSAPDDAVAREFTVFVGAAESGEISDAVTREFSVLVREPADFGITDASAREFSVHVPTPPSITLAASVRVYGEGDGWLAVDPQARVFDPDSSILGGGELRIEWVEAAAAGDRLTIEPGPDPITPEIVVLEGEILYQGVVIGQVSGEGAGPIVVSLNASASLAAVEALVRRVGFSNSLRYPTAGVRVAEFRLSDGATGFGPAATRGIQVVPVNAAPVAGPDHIGVERDLPLEFEIDLLLANDDDADGDPITARIVNPVSRNGGQVGLTDGRIEYTPPSGFTGIDAFDYRVEDPYGGVASGRVTVRVLAPDDPSVLVFEMTRFGSPATFRLRGVGLPGRSYRMLASIDLAAWDPVAITVASPIGGFTVDDPEAHLFPRRFYSFVFAAP
jgi:hypothetical protein